MKEFTFKEIVSYGEGPVAVFDGGLWGQIGNFRGDGTTAFDKESLLIRIENRRKQNMDISEEEIALQAINKAERGS